MRLLRFSRLRLRSRSSWAIAVRCTANLLFITAWAGIDGSVISSSAIAQSISVPASTCPQLTNRRYVVLLDRPTNLLPQLPNFLAIAAAPCSYLDASMTFWWF